MLADLLNKAKDLIRKSSTVKNEDKKQEAEEIKYKKDPKAKANAGIRG